MINYSPRINEKILNFKISGNGEYILLLHGYLETKELWDKVALELSQKFSIICPDLPGQGDSEALENQTIESMAESIFGLLDYLNIDKVHLFGHSMGGYVTLAFTELFPEKLNSFGLLHSHPFADSEVKKEQREKEIELIKKGKREMIIKTSVPGYFAPEFASTQEKEVDKALKYALKTTDDGMIACVSAMKHRKDRLQIMQNSSLHSLWIAGRKDELFPCSKATETAEELPKTLFKILENSGHVGMIEESAKTCIILNEFLNFLNK